MGALPWMSRARDQTWPCEVLVASSEKWCRGQCQGYKITLKKCLGLNEELLWQAVMLLSFCRGGSVCEGVVLRNVCRRCICLVALVF